MVAVDRAGCRSQPKQGDAQMASTSANHGTRELVEPRRGDKRYQRRDSKGRFGKSDDAGRSLAADIKQAAHAKVKSGQGDRGDH
jgi:hypothetical protein